MSYLRVLPKTYADLRSLPRSARRSLQRRLARSSALTATLPEYFQQRGRRLQRKMAWSLGGAALLLALGQGVGAAAIITVTTTNSDIAADGQCRSIEAIFNANNDAATFPDCPAGNGADTIVLPASANVILSTVNGLRYGQFGDPLGLPLITSPVTIEGNGATIARAPSAPPFGLIAVRFPGNLTLQNATLSGGSLFGGVSNGNDLSIKNSTISGNTGGGVHNFGNLAIENSTIWGNTAGGGVSNYGGLVTISNSTISGNTASTGGGIINCSGPYGSSFMINNSTISGNIANQGGGVSNGPYCGFYTNGNSNLSLNNSLIVGNQAAVAPEIQNVTDCPRRFGCAPNTINANNFNLFGSNGNSGVTGFAPGPTDIVPSVPLANILGPLQNNGGPTQTHALVAGSPAIDAGNPNGCRDNAGVLLQTDQRGFLRPADGNNDGTAGCDIGAYEASAVIGKNTTFVFQQYIDFLDREPGAGEVSAWVSALDNGLAKADLIEAFMNSGEFRFEGKFIAQTYLGILTRDADYAGFRSWLGALLGGLPREQIVQVFFDSGEFQSRFGSNLTNGQFVERMYNNVLLRSSDPGELNVWVGALNNGQLTKAQVALSLLDSEEFQGLFVSQNRVDISLLYFDMLQRDPDPGSFSAWVGVLSSGASLPSVIDGFLNSPEYRAGF